MVRLYKKSNRLIKLGTKGPEYATYAGFMAIEHMFSAKFYPNKEPENATNA